MSNEHEKTPEQQRFSELAERVAALIVAEPIQRRTQAVLAELLQSVKKDVLQGAIESLLHHGTDVGRQRDEEWARIMASIYQEHTDAELPTTNPHDMRNWLVAKQQERERTLKADNYRTGAASGFREGMVKGAKLGFGGCRAGHTLDHIVKTAEDTRLDL